MPQVRTCEHCNRPLHFALTVAEWNVLESTTHLTRRSLITASKPAVGGALRNPHD
jgi:hypothetical protein